MSCSGFLVGHVPPPALKHPFESVGWEPALSPVGFWEEGPALARSRALHTPFLAYSQRREPEGEGCSGFRLSPTALLLEMNLDRGNFGLPVMLSRSNCELCGWGESKFRKEMCSALDSVKKTGPLQSGSHCVSTASPLLQGCSLSALRGPQ